MYLNIVFLHSYEDDLVSQFLDFESEVYENQLFEHLVQWDYGDEELGASINATKQAPWGSSDSVEVFTQGENTYILSYNNNLGYVALTRKLS